MKTLTRFTFPLLLVLSMVLSACGAPAAPATEAPATGAPAGEGACPAGVEGKAIEMWSPFTGPDGDEMTALAERFSSENPCNITVTHIAQPDYVVKLNAAAAANQLPAMTAVRAINVAELAARNVLKPFGTEAMAVFGDDIASDFPEDVWNVGEYRGERYSFPLDVHPFVMYYNKEMFAAAGVEEPGDTPWTAAEFDDALAKLEASGVTPLSLGNGFQAGALWQALIRQYGGALTDEAGTTATYNSEAGVQALERIKELKDKYTPDVGGTGDPEVGVFKQGEAAITFHGPWHISDLSKLPFTGFAPLPTLGDQPATWGGSHQLALTTDDPATQAAAAMWIIWISENSVDWAKAGQVPARSSVRSSADLATAAEPISKVVESANIVVILPQVPELEGALWGQFGAVIDAYLAGDVTDPAAALEEANAKSQQIMDENVAKYE